MNRRSFLASLLGAATLDPERLLWVPGRKLISVPRPTVRGNSLLSIDEIAKEWAVQFQKNLAFHRAAFVLSYPPAK